MRGGLFVFFAMLLVPAFARAATNPAAVMAICQNAAIHAADRNNVPRDVLVAITLVETRTRRGDVSGAWPWTVNVAGKGFWFNSRAAALLHAQQSLARGQNSFDVGCFQLNYRWHGQHFASIDHMFEPGPSGDYAAKFLKSLHAETGNWIKAAGLYHSRTEKHASRYRGLVAATVRRMNGQLPQPVTEVASVDGMREVSAQTRSQARNWPLVRLGQAPDVGNGSLSRSGGVALNALRRSRGSLINAGPRGG